MATLHHDPVTTKAPPIRRSPALISRVNSGNDEIYLLMATIKGRRCVVGNARGYVCCGAKLTVCGMFPGAL